MEFSPCLPFQPLVRLSLPWSPPFFPHNIRTSWKEIPGNYLCIFHSNCTYVSPLCSLPPFLGIWRECLVLLFSPIEIRPLEILSVFAIPTACASLLSKTSIPLCN
ncbi:hypothetical protein AVEN_136356-1 [Araneus ventricosus]|uniref:Uncharacterized protein n=1 Tax=Araneus ventricosus TaxID=182803 RepID=A0A4Y2E553_ARAVE|nr:hypothetical protein AVEN_136356-1 [Araneus ventricosus]